MRTQLELSPQGVIICHDDTREELQMFHKSYAAGLIHIGGHALPGDVDASVLYWKQFAERFIRSLCHLPENSDATLKIEAPSPAELSEIILNAPPMRGAEYLSHHLLQVIWQRLTEWSVAELESLEGLSALLEKNAPRWSRVGRVTFHLAENKSDPDYPFAFMASYASGLSKSGRLQQLPLGKALQQYAGNQ